MHIRMRKTRKFVQLLMFVVLLVIAVRSATTGDQEITTPEDLDTSASYSQLNVPESEDYDASANSSGDLPIIYVKGKFLYDSATRHRFFVRGAGYDYDVSDTNEHQWRPALELLISTVPRLNTVRLYEVQPNRSYKQFMQMMNDNGVYVVVPITPSRGWCVLNRDGVPALSSNSCYPSCLLSFGQRIVNMFSRYPNTLAYTIGNEIIDSEDRWNAAPCIKAYARDLRQHMRQCDDLRNVPLIYSAADNSMPTYNLTAEENDRMKLDYLTCGTEDEQIDIFGLNLFRWCHDECTPETCESQRVYDQLADAQVPIILTEFGCSDFHYDVKSTKIRGQRDWREVQAIFAPNATDVWSGGIAYTYGVRGGPGFAFFTGGGRAALNSPGYTKNCGYPDDVCSVDLYSNQLEGIKKSEEEASIADQDDTDKSSTFASKKKQRKCPSISGINLESADSRINAPGYSPIGCPNEMNEVPNYIDDWGDGSDEESNSSMDDTDKINSKHKNSVETDRNKQRRRQDDIKNVTDHKPLKDDDNEEVGTSSAEFTSSTEYLAISLILIYLVHFIFSEIALVNYLSLGRRQVF